MITKQIAEYWDKQAEIWAEEKQEAWDLPETNYWIEYFRSLLPSLLGNTVLEVGTASGYFANILYLAGYEVTAIDLSEKMISQAKKISAEMNFPIDYEIMDAQNIIFKSGTYDLIFTRLMTWIIPDPQKFYNSCYDILKDNGMIINFDGDFGNVTFSQDGHEKYPPEIMEEANTIKSKLDISQYARPDKDLQLLLEAGFRNIKVDYDAQDRILHQTGAKSDIFELTANK